MNNLNINLNLLNKDIKPLEYIRTDDCGFDLRSSKNYKIKPQERCLVDCGFAIAIPSGFAGLIIPRSGLALKHGISIVNAPGLIDSNYRGEIKVVLLNTDKDKSFEININDRIAQMIIIPYMSCDFNYVDKLDNTQRNTSGFGSSGKQ